VVASRLSETDASVLVLEAGESEAPEFAIPGFGAFAFGSDRDWNIKGKSQEKSMLGFKDNVSFH